MDEKDRHIITFGEEEPEVKPVEPEGIAGETFVMKPSEPAAGTENIDYEPTLTVSPVKSGSPSETSETVSLSPDSHTEAPSASGQTVEGGTISATTEVEPGTAHGSEYTARRMASEGPAHVKPMPAKKKKEKKYVTKGALITCMIVTMLISSLLGAAFGGAFSKGTASDGRASRNDSKLSELNLSEATGSELTVGEIIAKNADAVVEIVVEGTTQGMWGQLQLTQGAGSGVIVKDNGYIATNYHVVEGANKVQVTLHNGEEYNANIVGTDPSNDIAVIKIDAKDLTTAVIGDSSQVSVGDLAVAIGNPLGQLGGTATSGIISALDRTLTVEETTLTLLQTDAAINGGNSGGGLFNGKGELIGIVESKASAVGVEGLAFALPINSVSEIINDMIENGGSSTNAAASTPAVGIVISEVSEENAEYYGLDSAGVYVAQVTGSNAQKAGFQEQDRIVSIDGKEISTSSEFISLVRKHKVGDTVTIVVSRGGQEIEIKTELEALNTTQN